MQEAFHGAFGEGLQNALLAPLEQETQAFKDTAKKLEDQHRTAMEARHYREKIVAMNAGKTKNDPEKLARNAGKSAEAERAAADAKKALEDAFAAHAPLGWTSAVKGWAISKACCIAFVNWS